MIVPTRGRPQAARELAQAFRDTCTANTRLILSVDHDDPMAEAYYSDLSTPVYEHRGSGMVAALNAAAVWLAKESYAIGFMGDDHRPRTIGWDTRYLEVLHPVFATRRGSPAMVYGNDLLQGSALPTQVAMTSSIVTALGFMAPPSLTHLYVDNFWLNLGTETGTITYLDDVVIEHMHPMADKALWDEGYRRVNDPQMFAKDATAYAGWKVLHFAECVDKVRAL